MNTDPKMSAMPCGCDPAIQHVAEQCQHGCLSLREARVALEPGLSRDAVRFGIGGAPTRATTFPQDAKGRKECPVASGVLDYFPDAIIAVAHVSWIGNEQHNPGQPLHWAREKSSDEADALLRHFLERGTLDTDRIRHSAKMAWRALALLQKEIEADRASQPKLISGSGPEDIGSFEQTRNRERY